MKQRQKRTAKFVKDIRLRLGLSQGELAEKLGVDRSTVTKYELGKVVPPGDVVLTLQEMVERG